MGLTVTPADDLRRIDWRVVLAGAPPGTIACDERGLAKAFAAAHPGMTPQGRHAPVNLLVRSHPRGAGRTTLPLVHDAWCAWEARRPIPPATRARLGRDGWQVVAEWWAWPPPARRPAVWLPAEAGAAAHALRAIPGLPGGRWRHAVAPAARLAPPRLVLMRRGGDPVLPLSAAMAEVEPGYGAETRWTLRTPGASALNKIIAIPLGPRDDAPRCAVKCARIEEAARALANEHRMLESVARGADDPRVRIPRPVLALPGVSAQTWVWGPPIMDALTPATYAELTDRVADALLAVARHTRTGTGPSPHLEGLADTMDEIAPGDGPAVASTIATAARLPSVAEHRDCSPWNVVLTADGTPGLLDWESAVADGVPGVDLAYFLTYAGLHLAGAVADPGPAAYRAAWDRSTPHGSAAHRVMHRHLTALGLDTSAARDLRALTWMVHASTAHRRSVRLGDAVEAARTRASRDRFLAFWREEVRR